MKLEPEEGERLVLHRGDRAGRGHGQGDEVGAGVVNLVAVAHPDDGLVGHAVEEGLGGIEDPAFRPAELASRGGALHLPAQGLGRQLHAVADAQHGNAHLEERRVAVRGAGLVDAARPAGEDQGQGVQLADPLRRDVVPDDPREGVPLADPPGDELDVLGSEVKDQDGSRRGIDGLHERLRSSRGNSRPTVLNLQRQNVSLPGGHRAENPNSRLPRLAGTQGRRVAARPAHRPNGRSSSGAANRCSSPGPRSREDLPCDGPGCGLEDAEVIRRPSPGGSEAGDWPRRPTWP